MQLLMRAKAMLQIRSPLSTGPHKFMKYTCTRTLAPLAHCAAEADALKRQSSFVAITIVFQRPPSRSLSTFQVFCGLPVSTFSSLQLGDQVNLKTPSRTRFKHGGKHCRSYRSVRVANFIQLPDRPQAGHHLLPVCIANRGAPVKKSLLE